MGDGAEHVTPHKGGAQLAEQVMPPTEQYKYLANLLGRIKGQCVGGVTGNHEQRAMIDAYVDPVELMFNGWGLLDRYFGVGGCYQIKVRNRVFNVTIFHGRRNSATNVYHEHLLRWRAFPRSDVIIIGHTHALGHYPNVYLKLNPDTGKEEAATVEFVRSGTYLGYADYARENAYPPGRIGSPVIWFSEEGIEVDDKTLAAI